MTCLLLEEMDSSDLNWLVQAATYRSVPSETFLVDSDQPSDHVFLILEGMVAIAAPIRQEAIAHSFEKASSSESWSLVFMTSAMQAKSAVASS